MGYHLNQYSPLSQINKSNIKRLVPIWSTSLSNDAGELVVLRQKTRRLFLLNLLTQYGHLGSILAIATIKR